MKDLALQPSDSADTAVGLEKLSAALNRIGITSQRAREDFYLIGWPKLQQRSYRY